MAIEVELKAWIEDPEKMRQTLRQQALFVRDFDKRDIYFARPGGERSLFRVRRDGDETEITYKRKERRNGIEINREHEFHLQDFMEFVGFCDYLGYIKSVEKHKSGQQFKMQEATVELCFVEGLGWFIEIEYLLDSERKVDAAVKRLEQLLKELGVDRSRIEPRYYTDMLMQQESEE